MSDLAGLRSTYVCNKSKSSNSQNFTRGIGLNRPPHPTPIWGGCTYKVNTCLAEVLVQVNTCLREVLVQMW